MTAERIGAWRSGAPGCCGDRLGCVVTAGTGVFGVLTDRGTVTASLSGDMLARVARDRRRRPRPGDWVRLREWPDGRITLGDCCTVRPPDAIVLPLNRP